MQTKIEVNLLSDELKEKLKSQEAAARAIMTADDLHFINHNVEAWAFIPNTPNIFAAFNTSMGQGLIPPVYVLEELYKMTHKYMKKVGRLRLTEAFSLEEKQGGYGRPSCRSHAAL